jgi:hypothetical protein
LPCGWMTDLEGVAFAVTVVALVAVLAALA